MADSDPSQWRPDREPPGGDSIAGQVASRIEAELAADRAPSPPAAQPSPPSSPAAPVPPAEEPPPTSERSPWPLGEAFLSAQAAARAGDGKALLEAWQRCAAELPEGAAGAHALLAGSAVAEAVGDLDQAASLADRAFARCPGDPLVRSAARLHAARTGDLPRLAEVLSADAEASSGDDLGRSLLELARVQERLGLGDEAVASLERAWTVAPDDARILSDLARLREARREWEAASDALEGLAAAHLSRGDAGHRHEAVAAQLRRLEIEDGVLSRPEQAARCCRDVLAIEPGHRTALAALGRLCARGGDWDGLVATLRAEAEAARDPAERAERTLRAAEVLEERQGRIDEAAEAYRSALEGDPGLPAARAGLERLLSREGRWADLCALLEEEARHAEGPRQRLALLERRAEVLEERLGEPERAVQAWEEVRSVTASHPTALRALGRLHAAAGRWDQVVATYQAQADAVRDPARAAELLVRAGEVAERRSSRPDEAVRLYREALTLEPSHLAALLALARLYRAGGEHEPLAEVLVSIASTREEPEERAAALVELGQLCEERLADPARALEAYDDALRADPRHLPALRAAERLCLSLRRPDALAALRAGAVADGKAGDRSERLLRLAWQELARTGDLALAQGPADAALAAVPGSPAATLLELCLAPEPARRERALTDLAGEPPPPPPPPVKEPEPEPEPAPASVALPAPEAVTEAVAVSPPEAVSLPEPEHGLEAVSVSVSEPEHAAEAVTLPTAEQVPVTVTEAVPEAVSAFASGPEPAPVAVPAFASGPELVPVAALAPATEAAPPHMPEPATAAASAVAAESAAAAAAAAESASASGSESAPASAVTPEAAAPSAPGAGESDDPASQARLREERAAAEADPASRATLSVQAGEAWERAGDVERALSAYQAALSAVPAHIPALRASRNVFAGRKDWGPVRATLQAEGAALADGTEAAAAFREAGAIAELWFGDVDGAVQDYRAALSRDPSDPVALTRVEALLGPDGSAALAEVHVARARAERDPGRAAEAWLAAARACQGGAEARRAALSDLDEALALRPDHAGALELRARLRTQSGQYGPALEDLDRALGLGGEPAARLPLHLAAAALCEERLPDPSGALHHTEAALELAPENTEALARLERLHRAAGRTPEAAAALRRLLAVPGLPRETQNEQRFALACLEVDRGDDQAALVACRQVLDQDRTHPGAVSLLALLERRLGPAAAPVEAVADAAPANNAGRGAPAPGARPAGQPGSRAAALEQLRAALELDPSRDDVRASLAELAEEGHPSLALEQHRRLLGRDATRLASWSALQRLFQRVRSHDGAYVAASVLRWMGSPVSGSEQLIQEGDRQALAPPPPLAPADLDLLRAPGDRGPLAEIVAVAGDALGQALADARAPRGAPVRGDHPFRRPLRELSRALGAGEFEIYGGPLGSLSVEPGDPPAVRIGADLAHRTTPREQRFLLGRVAARLHTRSALAEAYPGKLADAVGAAVRLVIPGYAGLGEPREDLADRLEKAISRKARKALETPARAFAHLRASPDLLAWRAAAAATADRTGLVLCGDVPTALDLLCADSTGRKPAPADRAAAVRAHPEALALLAFAATEAHLALRQRLRVAVA